jgi:hypothetical protein
MKKFEELKEEFENLGLRLEFSVNSENKPVARLYKATPRAKYTKEKMVWGYYFKSDEKRLEYANEFLENKINSIKAKEKYKKDKRERELRERESIKVGDVFNCSWGYEQTQQDFYQVVEKPTSSTIIVRPINSKSLEQTSWCSEYVTPIKESFIGENTYKYRLQGDSFKISSFQYANKIKEINGSKFYRSWDY